MKAVFPWIKIIYSYCDIALTAYIVYVNLNLLMSNFRLCLKKKRQLFWKAAYINNSFNEAGPMRS